MDRHTRDTEPIETVSEKQDYQKSFDYKIAEIRRVRLDRITREALHGMVDFQQEDELRELLKKEVHEVKTMKLFDLEPEEIVENRNASEVTERVKELLRSFKIARLIMSGDWKLNRKHEIAEVMGVKQFPEIMKAVNRFQSRHLPENDSKKVAVDLGCGNGEFCETLRAAPEDEETGNWEVFGYADRIYYTLNDFMHNLANSSSIQSEAMEEFVNVISILLIRTLNQGFDGKLFSKSNELNDLPEDPTVIRKILPNLESFIALSGRTKIAVDVEFLSDAEVTISSECQKLIGEYGEDPSAFVKKHFRQEAQQLSHDDENRLKEIDKRMAEIREELRPKTRRETRVIKKLTRQEAIDRAAQDDFETKKRERRTTIVECMQEIEALKIEKQSIIQKAPDLSKFISLYHYNVIPGKFDEFDKAFPEESIDLMFASRSTSHEHDTSYWHTLRLAATRLKPGGVFLDDGKRESWTRFERVSQLYTLQEELGHEYRLRIIMQGEEACSVLVEKGIKNESGHMVFCSDEEDFLADGSEFVNVDEWITKMPRLYVRNKVIDVLRGVLIGSTSSDLGGRLLFKDLHRIIDREVDTTFEAANLSMPFIPQLAKSAVDRVLAAVKSEAPTEIQRLFSEEAEPVSEAATVQTFRRTGEHELISPISMERSFKQKDLPRNGHVPELEALQMRAFELVNGLIILRDYLDQIPITLFEFDTCFTNRLMKNMLMKIFDDACFAFDIKFEDLVRTINIALKSGEYPDVSKMSAVNIIGGSTGDAHDKYGGNFTEQFCMPLLENIMSGGKRRVVGTCFGSQVLLQAFGQLLGIKIKTEPGALQFGAFPIAFTDDGKSLLRELNGESYTVIMTREGYSDVGDYSRLGSDIKPLAFEFNNKNDGIMVDTSLPPAAWSLVNGSVVTAQWHSEVPPDMSDSLSELTSWVKGNRNYFSESFTQSGPVSLKRVMQDPEFIIPSHFDLQAKTQQGIEPWVKKDVGPVFFLNTLANQVDTLLVELNLK